MGLDIHTKERVPLVPFGIFSPMTFIGGKVSSWDSSQCSAASVKAIRIKFIFCSLHHHISKTPAVSG